MTQDTPNTGPGNAVAPVNGSMHASTIDTTPSNAGFAQIAARFAAQIIEDVRKPRRVADSALLVEIIKVAGLLARTGDDKTLARLIVAVEQDEPVTL